MYNSNTIYMHLIHKKLGLLFLVLSLGTTTVAFSQSSEAKDPISKLFQLIKKEDIRLYAEYECISDDGGDKAIIDDKCLARNLSELKAMGIFSTTYLENLKKEYDSWKKDPELYNRDADIYFLNQDPDPISDYIKALGKAKVTTKNGTTHITLTLPNSEASKLTYIVVSENGAWKIESWTAQ